MEKIFIVTQKDLYGAKNKFVSTSQEEAEAIAERYIKQKSFYDFYIEIWENGRSNYYLHYCPEDDGWMILQN